MKRAASPPPAAFRGFPDPRGDFFLALALHNDRDWFQSHRVEYEQGWAAPMAALLAEVRDGLRGAYGRRAWASRRCSGSTATSASAGQDALQDPRGRLESRSRPGPAASPGATPAAMYLQVGVEDQIHG